MIPLSYENEHRPWQLYERTFYQFLGRCWQLDFGKRRFRFRNKLFILDATVIELYARLFYWAKFRRLDHLVTMTSTSAPSLTVMRFVIQPPWR